MRKRTRKPSKQSQGATVDFTATARELSLAYKRVNGVPARRLKWLLDFASTELNDLSEGRLADLRWEVVVFGLNRKPEQLSDQHETFPELGILTFPLYVSNSLPKKNYEREQQAIRAAIKKGASLELIREFQGTMRTAFDVLFTGEQWRVTRPSREQGIALSIRTPTGAVWAQNPPGFTGDEILLMQAIDLIKAERERLKICEKTDCRRRFVAAKKRRARFCSSRCSAWVRVNKARGKL